MAVGKPGRADRPVRLIWAKWQGMRLSLKIGGSIVGARTRSGLARLGRQETPSSIIKPWHVVYTAALAVMIVFLVMFGWEFVLEDYLGPYLFSDYERQDGFARWEFVITATCAAVIGVTISALELVRVVAERNRAKEVLGQRSQADGLLQKITAAANEAATLDEAMQACLDEMCRFTGWLVGHVYRLTEGDTSELVPTELWCLSDPGRFEAFRQATHATKFGPGVGLPGRVLATGEPVWIDDVTKDSNFLRTEPANAAGLKSGFAFPVLMGREVVAALEFFSENAAKPDGPFLDVVIQVGIQLGRVVGRERAEGKWNRLTMQLRHHLQETRDARFRYEEEATAHAHLAKELALAKDEMQAAFEKSEESEQRYRVLVEHSPVGIWQIAPDGKIIFANSALCALLEVEGIEDITDKNYRSFLSPESVPIVDRECANWSQGIASTCEATFISRRSRKKRHVEISGAPLSSTDGQVLNVLSTVVDLTERKDAEALIRKLALNDPLTGLANRNLFKRRLELALQNANRGGHAVALMFLDLDGFKNVNDNFGHPIGDALLKEVAERLVKSVREVDTVARLGGDEFAVVAAKFGDIETIHKIAARIIDRLKEVFVVDGISITSGTSIGISFFPHDAMEAQDLIKNADLALYQAKTRGRGVYQLYDEKLHAEVKARMGLERDLRLALERGEFALHYQPQLDLTNHDLMGVEALIRWQHPERGLVPPSEFIPIAEAVGLIAPLGEWVLEAACKQNKAWQNAGLPSFRVAVNVSADQFKDGDFVTKVEALLEESQMDPRWLELEITEGVVVDGSDEVVERLRRLSELGAQIAIDDFGTGYSSLAYLKKFPIHRLKIDQSFVKDLTTQPDLAAITDAVIQLGHSLNLQVTAEGVESEEQVTYLRAQGCDEAQGYHYSRPLPAEKLAEWVAEKYNITKG